MPPESDPRRSRLRWWPAALVLAAAGVALHAIWTGDDPLRQRQTVRTLKIAVLTGMLLFLWLVAASGLRWRLRLGIAAGVVLAGLAALATLEIRGVTGDLVPILAWRWSHDAAGVGVGVARTPLEPEDAPAFPQFLGPRRDGVLPGLALARDWSEHPPEELWRHPVGQGWAGFAVARGLAVTLEQHGPEERVVAYDLETGEPRWSHADLARHETTVGGVGPRSTPTIVGEAVYTVGATGRLNALDLASGRRLWSRDTVADHHGVVPDWGKSNSPLVLDGRVYVAPGGREGPTLAAYDAADGRPLWATGDDEPSYSSPVLAELAGRRQVVLLSRSQVAGYDPESGERLWTTAWPFTQPNVAQPLPLGGDRLLVSTGYGIGAKLYRLERTPEGRLAPAVLWESRRMKSKFANFVQHEGRVYGLDDGVLVCLDPQTGERCWKRGRYGHGQLLLVGDLLLVQTEKGELVLVEPDPGELRELAHFQVFDGKTWNPPALAGDRLLLRTHEEAVCLRLPLADGGEDRLAATARTRGAGG